MFESLEKRRLLTIPVVGGIAAVGGGATNEVFELIVSSGVLQLRNGAVARQGMTARTADGDAIERIDLPPRGKPGLARVTVVEDFAPARAALATSDWNGAPFTRAHLRATLGLPPMREMEFPLF